MRMTEGGTSWAGLGLVVDVPGESGSARANGEADSVARRLVELVQTEGLNPGDRLPGEEQLVALLGVGRETVRQALWFLEGHGVITVENGASGEVVLAGVHTGAFARMASLYFHLAGIDFNEMFDAWRVTAPPMAGLAAENPDRELVRTTLAPFLAGRFGDLSEVPDGAALHAAVAELSRNRVLLLLSRTVGHVLTEQVVAAMPSLVGDGELNEERVRVADAIARGHRRRAESFYGDYVDQVIVRFRERHAPLMQTGVRWR
jgi:GntR family transcriptional regulator, transcriptional repressor for pyruvate dehydrogenase complex